MKKRIPEPESSNEDPSVFPFMPSLFQKALSLFFPGTCILCGSSLFLAEKGGGGLCLDCLRSIERIRGPVCAVCGQPLISEQGVCMRCRKRNFAFEENLSLFLYTGISKRLIQQYKFRGYRICAEFFALHIAALYAERYSGLIVVPVPGRKKARLKRGFDQVEEICRNLTKLYRVPWLKALKRSGSRSQKSLSYEDRITNLKGKISIRKRALPLPESCILLDDVFTTGATAHECSLVLKENGVKEVHMITLAID